MPFHKYQWESSNDPQESFEDVCPRFKFPCDEHTHTREAPHYRLNYDGHNHVQIIKVCQEHGQVVSATIKIDPAWNIKVGGFELCVKGVISDTLGTIHNTMPGKPDTP